MSQACHYSQAETCAKGWLKTRSTSPRQMVVPPPTAKMKFAVVGVDNF